ncbi:PQQ-dependent sugar dehydrogenase [Candidatus Daviesbacteria bacterium]|nr:PQQ-dependent sugar dehydrogenase [Candidatus Daviesbacteria bacterium]
MKQRFVLMFAFFTFLLIVVGAYVYSSKNTLKAIPTTTETSKNLNSLSEQNVKISWDIQVVAQGLEVPWDIAISPQDELFITERPGQVKILTKDGKLINIANLRQVSSNSESGLTGIALHPNFNNNNFLYLYYSYQKGNSTFNRVSRFTFQDNTLSDEQIILNNLPGGPIHNGGRLRFGPDQKLWILTGDAGFESLAQNLNSLGGKVLRLNDDGTIPSDNPIKGSAIYSYGHRNPQGIDWYNGNLFISEHGSQAFDEINLIEPNKNYGWPIVKRCFSDDPKFVNPILCSEQTTWAPSGLAFIETDIEELKNSLFFAGLRGQLLERAVIEGRNVQSRETILKDTYGRLRAVTADDKGNVYISTSNRDGRGIPQQGDDKILKVSPKF